MGTLEFADKNGDLVVAFLIWAFCVIVVCGLVVEKAIDSVYNQHDCGSEVVPAKGGV